MRTDANWSSDLNIMERTVKCFISWFNIIANILEHVPSENVTI